MNSAEGCILNKNKAPSTGSSVGVWQLADEVILRRTSNIGGGTDVDSLQMSLYSQGSRRSDRRPLGTLIDTVNRMASRPGNVINLHVLTQEGSMLDSHGRAAKAVFSLSASFHAS